MSQTIETTVIDQPAQRGKLQLVEGLGFSWQPHVGTGEYADRFSYVFHRPDGIISKVSVVVRVADAGRVEPRDYAKTGSAPEILGQRV